MRTQSLECRSQLHFIWPIFVAIVSVLVGMGFSPYKGLATASYLILLIGLIYRKNQNVHVSLMCTGMGLDLILLLTLEIQRSAIATATGAILNSFQLAHVIFSTLAVVVYIPTFILGYKRWRKTLNPSKKKLHLYFGIIAFALRTIGYVLMFSMVSANT